MTVLVVLPLQIELDAAAAALAALGYHATPTSVGRIAGQQIAALGLTLACGGHGKTQFGVRTQHLLDALPAVDAVICCGVAGALAPELAVGDLVLAAETVEHDYTERFTPRPPPRFAADPALLAALQSLPTHDLPFRVHADIVASGDEDVIDRVRGAALREATGACAVAWEGAGGARAAAFSGVPYLELRAISDTADHQAAADFRANLGRAMANIATLLVLWRAA